MLCLGKLAIIQFLTLINKLRISDICCALGNCIIQFLTLIRKLKLS